MKHLILLGAILMIFACKTDRSTYINTENLKRVEAITPLGDTLYSYSDQDSNKLANYTIALAEYEMNQENPETLIWLGRRTAYLGKYRESIEIYTKGIKMHEDEPRFYRHRGHRYISIREYDKAINDLEKAAVLIRGQKNEIEPDGIPNEKGIPISSLHGNIYYHLALAYYLKNDLSNALRVYDLRTATDENDDNLVASTHWKYMALRRDGYHDEAKRLLTKIDGSLGVIENISYWEMCLFYKGILNEDWFVKKIESKGDADVFLYGLGNWHLYETKDTIQAQKYYQQLMNNGNKASFAYLAAESDLVNLFSN